MSDIESVLNNTKINIDKFGFFFWLILFAFIEMIFSIIHDSHYVAMGFFFLGFGLLGYALSELMDRISYGSFKRETVEQAGKKVWVVRTPLWFHILNVIIKSAVFAGLLLTVNWKYDFI